MGKGKGIPDEFTIDADIDANVTSSSDMVADVSMDTTMALDTTMRLPDPIRTEMTIAPLRTEMDTVSRMAITEPIRTEMQMQMDVKPIVLDLCLNLGINKLPRTCVKRPYEHRLCVSVMGKELAAVSLAGHRDVIIDDLDTRPAVAWGSDDAVRNPRPPGGHAPAGRRAPPTVSGTPRSGLRIDLGT